tara:strand:+ start:4712 stop:4951 length:240 start_codon:yes stop_codon:yes gene_type:complete
MFGDIAEIFEFGKRLNVDGIDWVGVKRFSQGLDAEADYWLAIRADAEMPAQVEMIGVKRQQLTEEEVLERVRNATRTTE